MLNFSGFEGALSAPCVGVANAAFFGFPELRFRWCLAFLHPLPTSVIQLVPCSGCAMLNFSGFEGLEGSAARAVALQSGDAQGI